MKKFIVSCCILALVVNCNKSPTALSPVQSNAQYVTLTYRGAVVPNPLSSTITIGKDSVCYLEENSNSIFQKWSKPTVNNDFDSLMSFITQNQIVGMKDPVKPDSAPFMSGSMGEFLAIKTDVLLDTITMSGVVSPSYWPRNLTNLVNRIDSLQTKYQKMITVIYSKHLSNSNSGQIANFTAGDTFTITLQTIGAGMYGTPVISNSTIQFLGDSLPLQNPGGPTQVYLFRAASIGNADISISHTVNNSTFTLSCKVAGLD